jgi:hypothetical protein
MSNCSTWCPPYLPYEGASEPCWLEPQRLGCLPDSLSWPPRQRPARTRCEQVQSLGPGLPGPRRSGKAGLVPKPPDNNRRKYVPAFKKIA